MMLPYLRFRLKLRSLGPTRVAHPHPGATPSLYGPRLRRVIGRALVADFCPFDEPRCETTSKPPRTPAELCATAQSCPYGVLVAASLGGRPPLALYVPPIENYTCQAMAELTLCGPAWCLYPWVLKTTREALWRGLDRNRVRWDVASISRWSIRGEEQTICDGDLRQVPADLEPHSIALSAVDFDSEPMPQEPSVLVEFLSPSRLVRNGRLVRSGPLEFEVLVGRILDRIGDLFGRNVSPLLQPENRQRLLRAAQGVSVLEDHTHWVEAPDYSQRQKAELQLGGKVGRIVYSPEAGLFRELLQAGEVVQVGKNAASGCGRIRVKPR